MSPQPPVQNGAQPLTPQSDGTPRTTADEQGPPPSFSESNSPEPKTHTVQHGETLPEIAHKYNHAGEAAAIWELNLGHDMGDGNRFGDFQHMATGGMPLNGWVIWLPAEWDQPQQPQPQAVQSDADRMAALMAEVKALAAKIGQPV